MFAVIEEGVDHECCGVDGNESPMRRRRSIKDQRIVSLVSLEIERHVIVDDSGSVVWLTGAIAICEVIVHVCTKTRLLHDRLPP